MLSADSLDNPVEKDKHVAKLFDVGKAIGTGQKLTTSAAKPLANASQTRTQRLAARNNTKTMVSNGIEPTSTNKALMEITTSNVDENEAGPEDSSDTIKKVMEKSKLENNR